MTIGMAALVLEILGVLMILLRITFQGGKLLEGFAQLTDKHDDLKDTVDVIDGRQQEFGKALVRIDTDIAHIKGQVGIETVAPV